jgi:hypothetical protein
MTMITFEVSDVEPPMGPRSKACAPVEAVASLVGLDVEAAASNLPNLVRRFVASEEEGEDDLLSLPDSTNPFVAAVHAAFAWHFPLILSPDDVWLCIAQGFGIHVKENAERLRGRFVRHEGRTLLEVVRNDFVKGATTNNWQSVFAEFSDRIAGHIGKQRDLVVAQFSTTGPIERAASEVVLMSAMQNYFSYQVTTYCGIPRITLLGTTDDWRSIRTRAAVLAEYELGSWVDALLPILDQFVAASEGRVDRAFWQSFYSMNSASGGPFITGWINVLFPYLTQLDHREEARTTSSGYLKRWQQAHKAGAGPTSDQFPSGMSVAPFIWEYLGTKIPMEFLGGFIAVSQNPEALAVRPAIGWAVRERRESAGAGGIPAVTATLR